MCRHCHQVTASSGEGCDEGYTWHQHAGARTAVFVWYLWECGSWFYQENMGSLIGPLRSLKRKVRSANLILHSRLSREYAGDYSSTNTNPTRHSALWSVWSALARAGVHVQAGKATDHTIEVYSRSWRTTLEKSTRFILATLAEGCRSSCHILCYFNRSFYFFAYSSILLLLLQAPSSRIFQKGNGKYLLTLRQTSTRMLFLFYFWSDWM